MSEAEDCVPSLSPGSLRKAEVETSQLSLQNPGPASGRPAIASGNSQANCRCVVVAARHLHIGYWFTCCSSQMSQAKDCVPSLSPGSLKAEAKEQLKHEAADLMKKFQILEDYKWKLLGENLETCSIEELQEIEGQVERSLYKIRQKKYHVLSEQIAQLKEKERILLEKNASLQEKEKTLQQNTDSTEVLEAKMEELFIGRPEFSKNQSIPRG